MASSTKFSFAFAFAAGSSFGLGARRGNALRSPYLRRCQAPKVRRVSVTPVCSDASPTSKEEKPVSGRAATAKEFAKLYGGSYIGTSMSMSAVSFICWYLLVQAGVDVVGLIQGLGDWLATTPIGRPDVLSRINETVGTATLAYIAHKASSPLRFPLTIAATPFVARAFSKKVEVSDASVEE